jgi:hypothetical protein
MGLSQDRLLLELESVTAILEIMAGYYEINAKSNI